MSRRKNEGKNEGKITRYGVLSKPPVGTGTKRFRSGIGMTQDRISMLTRR
jgi:hypothetical protein